MYSRTDLQHQLDRYATAAAAFARTGSAQQARFAGDAARELAGHYRATGDEASTEMWVARRAAHEAHGEYAGVYSQ
ncbi:MAG TPA: hypothetical protein VN837_05405 [Chloroflexota bacterium]|nr:hypothetical protein [Chloroflexota bacterium]